MFFFLLQKTQIGGKTFFLKENHKYN